MNRGGSAGGGGTSIGLLNCDAAAWICSGVKPRSSAHSRTRWSMKHERAGLLRRLVDRLCVPARAFATLEFLSFLFLG